MTPAAPVPVAITKAVAEVMRKDRGRLMAALVSRLRDFQLAEDALQDAAISALSHWGRAGLPTSPQGWLLKVAMRKAIDRLRNSAREARKSADLTLLAGDEADESEAAMIPDERLALIFTCCHPALEPKSQVALTLRTVCGLTTSEIARAFLDHEPAMGQRLSRAKAKIAAAGIPFRVPDPEAWDERLHAVLSVIYLIYNAGYTAGPMAPRDLCDEATYLARVLITLRPDQAEVEGCLALMLFSLGRKAARVDKGGASVPPQDQDRSLWNRDMLAQADGLLRTALARQHLGPHQIKAAIAACHVMPATPDWPQIRALYDTLLQFEPTDVVRLNLCVAMAEAGDLSGGLALLATVAAALDGYQPFHAAHAALAGKAGLTETALGAYARAIAMAANPQDVVFLTARRAALLS